MAVKNRIVELKMLPPSRLREHPLNFRMHPENQKTVVQQLLEKFGIVDALAVYKTKGDQYMIVNGHLRRDILSDEKQIPFSTGEIEWSRLVTVLGLPKEKDRRGEVGMTRIIPAKTFLEMWDKQKK